MDDFASIIKLGALFIIGMTALVIAYKCVAFIYHLTTCKALPPTADAKPVPETEQHEPENDIQLFERRYGKASGQ